MVANELGPLPTRADQIKKRQHINNGHEVVTVVNVSRSSGMTHIRYLGRLGNGELSVADNSILNRYER